MCLFNLYFNASSNPGTLEVETGSFQIQAGKGVFGQRPRRVDHPLSMCIWKTIPNDSNWEDACVQEDDKNTRKAKSSEKFVAKVDSWFTFPNTLTDACHRTQESACQTNASDNSDVGPQNKVFSLCCISPISWGAFTANNGQAPLNN